MNIGRPTFTNHRVFLVGLFTLMLAAAALLLAATAGTTPARAAEKPFTVQFDESTIDAGFLGTVGLEELSGPSSIDGTIDDAGNLKIPKGSFVLPVLDVSSITGSLIGIDSPVEIQGFMGIEKPATGTYNRATGKMEIQTKAGLWVSINIQQLLAALGGLGVSLPPELGAITGLLGDNLTCGFSPMDVTFTTEATSLGTGQRFSDGLDGPGALTGEWSQLGPFAGKTKIFGILDACTTIRGLLPGLLSGLGGGALDGLDLTALLASLDDLDLGPSALTITRTADVSTPTGKAKLKLNVSPKRRSLKPGRSTTYRVTVRNKGRTPASKARVCAKAARSSVRGTGCVKLGTISAGKVKQAAFRLKLVRNASPKNYEVSFRMTAAGGVSGSTKAWIAKSGR